jgi:phosphoglycerate dehydrogenase-like enzyme
MISPTIACSGPIGDVAVEILKPFGKIVVAEDSSEEALLQIIEGAVGLVLRGDGSGSARVIDAAAHLKVIGRSGVGFDKVDIPAANTRKIPVIITPGANSQAVAEAALAYMLVLSKKVIHWDRQLKQGNWKSRFEQSPGDLEGANLGIIGFGRIGCRLAQLVRPFGMKVLACDPYIADGAAEAQGAIRVELEELLHKSDFVSIHTLLTEETRGLLNRTRLGLMKPGAFLINLARGAVIESLDVLYETLASGPLAGAALDVFEPEPPDVSHPIFKLDNCLTAPHAICMSERAMFNSFKMMAEDMAAVLQDRRPKYVANPEVLG